MSQSPKLCCSICISSLFNEYEVVQKFECTCEKIFLYGDIDMQLYTAPKISKITCDICQKSKKSCCVGNGYYEIIKV